MPEYGQFTDPLGTLNDILGEPDNQMLNPESYAPSNRPQDIRYTFPERGVEPHGVRDDTETEDYFPDQVSGDPQIETFDGPVYAEIVPPIPVPVYDVPNPLSSIRKWSTFMSPYTASPCPIYDFTNYPNVPDPNTVMSIGGDSTRVKTTFVLTVPQFAGTLTQRYGFAISSDSTFQRYIPLVASNANGLPFRVTLENCDQDIFIALIPLAAYGAANLNICDLQIIQEFAKRIDANPYEVSDK